MFAALEQLPEQLLFCFPNTDAGSRHDRSNPQFSRTHQGRSSLIWIRSPIGVCFARVTLMLGNSSSGIMETPSLPFRP